MRVETDAKDLPVSRVAVVSRPEYQLPNERMSFDGRSARWRCWRRSRRDRSSVAAEQVMTAVDDRELVHLQFSISHYLTKFKSWR